MLEFKTVIALESQPMETRSLRRIFSTPILKVTAGQFNFEKTILFLSVSADSVTRKLTGQLKFTFLTVLNGLDSSKMIRDMELAFKRTLTGRN